MARKFYLQKVGGQYRRVTWGQMVRLRLRVRWREEVCWWALFIPTRKTGSDGIG